MAFSYTFEENFESGGIGGFNSEQDDNGVLNILSFRQIAGQYPTDPMPYRGAYACQVNLAGNDTSSHQYLEETTGFDVTAGNSLYVRFVFFVTGDLVMAASDRFTIFAMRSASADEIVVDIRNNSGVTEVLAAETGSASTVRNAALTLGEWHTAELDVTLDSGGGNDGTVDFYLDGTQVGAQLGSLDQAAVTHARLGIISADAGSTTGRIYFSEITADDARMYPHTTRFSDPRVVTKNSSVFVGPGHVSHIEGLVANADNRWFLFDTDLAGNWTTGGTPNDLQGYVVEYQPALTAVGAPVRLEGPWHFRRGCYAYMTGTTPKFNVHLVTDSDSPGVQGPLCQDDGTIRNWTMRS